VENEIILVNKPKGITSAKVVDIIKKKFNVKAGHTGTLDPLATGLLIILTGDKTKQFSSFLNFPKVYEVEGILGIKTDTFDLEGKVLAKNKDKISKKQLKEVLKNFKGEIEQIPPVFSAKKIKGKQAYKLSREGKEVKLSPQKVKIYSLSILSFKYPYFKLVLKVSSGFYVRSFINDIGEKLKVGATAKEIKRIAIGPYKLEQSKNLKELI